MVVSSVQCLEAERKSLANVLIVACNCCTTAL